MGGVPGYRGHARRRIPRMRRSAWWRWQQRGGDVRRGPEVGRVSSRAPGWLYCPGDYRLNGSLPVKKGRHRRFEEARALKRTSDDFDAILDKKDAEPCPECGAT